MIKRFLVVAALLLVACFSVWANSSSRVTLTVGALRVIDLPFVMENYRPSTKGIIRVDTSFSNKQIKIIGERQGTCELEVSGGGLTKVYSISVVNNIGEVLKQLQTDLDALPELDISVNQDYIVIRGEVSSIANWEYLLKVLSTDKFRETCRNYAKFRPAPELIVRLKQLLGQSGFTLTEDAVPKGPGDISVQYANNVLTISGNVYQPSDIQTINEILATQNWLSFGKDDKNTEGKVKAIVHLKTIPTTLWVDVVFVAISKQDIDRLGTDSMPSLTGSFSSFYDLVSGRGDGTAIIGANLNSTIQFLAANGVTRMHDAGCLVLKSNDKDGATQHIGGTKYVKVAGIENGSLQEIKYGLNITVKGGLVAKGKVDLLFDLNNDGSVSVGEDGSYDQTKESVKNSIVCELENTAVLGGYKRIAQSTANSGLPILRSTPVLKWFVSSDADAEEEFDLLILACPRLQRPDAGRKIALPIVDEVSHVVENGKIDNGVMEERDERRRGWLSWLNWFDW